MSPKSACHRHQLWRDGGVQALAARGPSGSRCRLSPRCLEKLAAYLDEGPVAHGWVEDQVCTAERVATLIGRNFHVSYSVSGATRLMHRLGFSPLVPARGEQAVTVWREATWAEVKSPGGLRGLHLLRGRSRVPPKAAPRTNLGPWWAPGRDRQWAPLGALVGGRVGTVAAMRGRSAPRGYGVRSRLSGLCRRQRPRPEPCWSPSPRRRGACGRPCR
ncbi:winged helix-turn-helix domain-containing protein [Streptomyces sp. NBC_01092]|uniref:winged helix-turn-helix domain-containing protein n=1 Tax=Streptomyces sp. NBC_01092 TaxID=2903748 RepID=UPI00386774F8